MRIKYEWEYSFLKYQCFLSAIAVLSRAERLQSNGDQTGAGA
jgi:hypothetical protein